MLGFGAYSAHQVPDSRPDVQGECKTIHDRRLRASRLKHQRIPNPIMAIARHGELRNAPATITIDWQLFAAWLTHWNDDYSLHRFSAH